MAKYTADGMPVISKATLASLVDIFKRELRDRSFVQKELNQLRGENPVLRELWYKIYRENHGKGDHYNGFANGFMGGVYMTYELLRRQSGANKMENDVNV